MSSIVSEMSSPRMMPIRCSKMTLRWSFMTLSNLSRFLQKVEARNFDIRNNLLKFDNVMNDQRKVIFEQRIGIMRGEDISETIDDMRHEVVDQLIAKHIPENVYAEQWDAVGLRERLRESIGIDFPVDEWAKEEGIAEQEIGERVTAA